MSQLLPLLLLPLRPLVHLNEFKSTQQSLRSQLLMIRCCLSLFVAIVATLVGFVAMLGSSQELQAKWFSKLCAFIVRTETAEMRDLRCNTLQHVHSKVLEVGFGTGGNLRCFSGW